MKQVIFIMAFLILPAIFNETEAKPRYRQTKCPEAKRPFLRINFSTVFPKKESTYIPEKEKANEQVVKEVDRSNFYVKNYKEPKQRFHEKGWKKWQCR